MPGYRPLREEDPPLAFLDCVPIGAAEAIVIGAIWGLEDTHDRPTRLLHVADDRVGYADVDANIVSLCRSGEGALALSKSGIAVPVLPEIGEPEPVARPRGGTMLQIRDWNGVQFACGMNGQVYRRKGGVWSPFDDGLYSAERSVYSEQLRDIGGVPGRRLVTVGTFGSVHEHDGGWRRREVPTNANLEQVGADPEGRLWIAGARGTLVRSDGAASWDVLDSGTDASFWGMSTFRGELFLSSLEGLWAVDRETGLVAPVDPGFGWPFTTYRLRASETDLWSIGPDDIARFDGTGWRRIAVPSNELRKED
jgi:hypothetical protein